jgi:hypothetical protein
LPITWSGGNPSILSPSAALDHCNPSAAIFHLLRLASAEFSAVLGAQRPIVSSTGPHRLVMGSASLNPTLHRDGIDIGRFLLDIEW